LLNTFKKGKYLLSIYTIGIKYIIAKDNSIVISFSKVTLLDLSKYKSFSSSSFLVLS